MPALFANNASGPLAASIAANGTTLVLSSGFGAPFPQPDAEDGEYFFATLVNASNEIEIVKCTQRINDSFVIERGQEGTTARIYDVGDKFELRVTAGGMASKLDKDGGVITGDLEIQGDVKIGGGSTNIIEWDIAGIHVANPITFTGEPIDFQNTISVAGSALVSSAGAATLTNKTIDTGQGNIIKLGGNTLTAPSGGATLTFPNTTDTIVGRATTDTLTNKTLVGLHASSSILNGAGSPVAIGYRDIPQNRQDGNYVITPADAGRHIYCKPGGGSTITVPSHASQPNLLVGAAVTIVHNGGGELLIASGGPILIHGNTTVTGNKTLASKGVVTLLKVENDLWFIL